MLLTMAGQVQALYSPLTFPLPGILIPPCSNRVVSLQDEIGGDCAKNTSGDYASHEGTCNGLRILLIFTLQPLLLQQRTEYESRQSFGYSPVKFHPSLKTSNSVIRPIPDLDVARQYLSSHSVDKRPSFSFFALLPRDWIGCEAGEPFLELSIILDSVYHDLVVGRCPRSMWTVAIPVVVPYTERLSGTSAGNLTSSS
jgi:hypothetical protein